MQPYPASPQGGYYQAACHEHDHAGANTWDAANDTANDPNTDNADGDAPSSWTTGPSAFVPTFSGIPPALIDEHNQCVLLLAGGEEERALYQDICLHIASYLDTTKKAIILQQELGPVEAVDLMHLAMTTFRYPPKAQTAIQLFAMLTDSMLQNFSQWWTADGRITETIGSSQDRDRRAANLKERALAILRVNLQLNSESRWLFTLLRALGHIPELWEGSILHPDSNAEASQALASGMSNSQYAQAARPMHGVPCAPQVPTAAPFPHSASVPDNFYGTTTPVQHDVPLAFQPRTAATPSQPQPAPSWGQGAPSAPYLTRFSQRQPASPVILDVSMRDASSFTFQQPTQTHASANRSGPVNSPVSPPGMPTFPSNMNNARPDTTANPPFMLHRGGSGSLRSVNSYSSRESRTQMPNTSSPRTQRQPPDLDALIELERVRLLQMECQLEKIKHLTELFYRALYLELSRYFTSSHLCSIYQNMLSGLSMTLDSLAMQMYAWLTRDLAFLSKYV